MPVANIRNATTTVAIIEGDQVKQADELTTEDGRKLLIVKGGNSQKLVERVLKEFSTRRTDRGILLPCRAPCAGYVTEILTMSQ